MTKAFAQEENFWNYEFRIFNMIKHRNNKVKVFTIMNTPISFFWKEPTISHHITAEENVSLTI